MNNYIKGLVSVVMPTYRRSDQLIRAIESVLNQTYKNIELLLINDNEPDDEYTKELKERVSVYCSDERFNLILQDKHINGAVARNLGIREAKGEYVAFLDDDDWWELNKIEIQVKELEALDYEWGGISCRIKRYNGNELISVQPMYREGYVYKDILMLLSDFETGTLLLRHEALDKTRCFDEKLLRHQDLQLLVDFTYQFKLKQVNSPLHCRDISDAQNRPNVEKIINAKKDFFVSIKPIFYTLTRKERKLVRLMHNAELGYVKLKNKDIFGGLLCLLGVLSSPKALFFEYKKIKEKIVSRKAVRRITINEG